jgi:putative FmdB family regulatory protein
MPTYEYVCENGHEYLEIRGINDDAKTETCVEEGCGAKLKRVFGTPPIIFNGTGFSAKRG